MRYMMVIKHSEDFRRADVPASLHKAMGKFIEEATRNGNFVAGAGLQPSSAATRVRLSGRRISFTDGPFVETKELIGGYAIMNAKTHDEAIDLALRFMEVHLEHWPAFEGECEVRPFEVEALPTA
jgi:hypothetical protein